MSKKNRRKPQGMEICLCPRCASSFYHPPGTIIRRRYQYQAKMDLCDFCNYRYGIDYVISHRVSSVQNRNTSGISRIDGTNGSAYTGNRPQAGSAQ